MNFNLFVTITATPELLAAITSLATSRNTSSAVESAKEEPAQKKKVKKAEPEEPADTASSDVAEKKSAPAEKTTISEKSASNEKNLSLEEVHVICREVIDEDDENRTKIKNILSKDFDVAELKKLDSQHYAAFVKKVKALVL